MIASAHGKSRLGKGANGPGHKGPAAQEGSEVKKRAGRTLGGLVASCALLLALSAPAAGAAGCPNEALREAQGATALPDCMALEMVSPPRKFAEPAFSPSFSLDGERVLFTSQAALVNTPGYQDYAGDRYIATRAPAGWGLASTAPPLPELVAGGRHLGSPSAFTPALDRWAQLGATQSQGFVGLFGLFGGGLDGSFAPLSPQIVPVDNSGSQEIQFSVVQIDVNGSAADLTSTVLQGRSSLISYLPGDPKSPPGVKSGEPGEDRNSYVASVNGGEPTLELMARDKDGTVYGGRCGAHLGGSNDPFATTVQGALSASGTRIFFSTRPAQPFNSETGEGPTCDTDNPIRILRRSATEAGPEITPFLPGGLPEWEQPGDDLFEAASADGTKVYLATPRKLTGSDTDASGENCSANLGASKGCDLYLYDASKPEGERLTQVSAGEDSSPADVLTATTAISGDGSRAYFIAQGVLTSDTNPKGASAVLGKPNLYLYDAGTNQLAFLGTLAEEDKGALWGASGSFFGDAFAAPLYGPGGPEEETGGDGHALVFASKAPLTADDEDGGFGDVFRYDADSDTLERVSKAAPGGSDNGPFDVTVNPNGAKIPESNFGEQSRWAGEDGQSIAFATEEALLPGDGDEEINPYVWKAGELGAASAKVGGPPALAPGGEEIAFSTRTALLPQDKDTAADVYVARSEGGFPLPIEPGGGCNPLPEGGCLDGPSLPPPPVPGPTGDARGNVSEPPRCKKGFVKKKGRCVKKPKHRKAKKRAGRKQGGRR